MTESYDQKIQKAMSHLIPVYTHLELTYRCNERCIHCYATVNATKQKELTIDEYKNILDQLADLGTLYLAMTGGEIFVRNDFFKIAQYAKKKSFALRLFTNAYNLTEDIIQQIVDLNPLRIEISLYGMTESVHDQITNIPGSFNRTMDGINQLIKKGLNLTIKVPVMQQNLSEVNLVKKFAEERSLEFISNPTIVPRGDGSIDNLQYRLTNKQLQYYFEKINHEWYFKQPALDKTLCGAGKGIMAISPYGEVFPCVQMPIKVGDLRKQSLREIWFNSSELKQVRSLVLSKIKGCSSCENIQYCNPCPGLALVEDGDLFGPSSEACRQANVRKAVFTNKKDWQPNPNIPENECLV